MVPHLTVAQEAGIVSIMVAMAMFGIGVLLVVKYRLAWLHAIAVLYTFGALAFSRFYGGVFLIASPEYTGLATQAVSRITSLNACVGLWLVVTLLLVSIGRERNGA